MHRKLTLGLVIATAACTKSVPQDLRTGDDGRSEGARAMRLEHDRATARGIVTYPGGDRVDWRLLELPASQRGTVSLRLDWTSPRPGLDLSFNVYDGSGRLLQAAVTSTSDARRARKVATVSNVGDALLIEVYASRRRDAGDYTLTAVWEPTSNQLDWLAVKIPDPPPLPQAPSSRRPCNPNAVDMNNPTCREECPNCDSICPTPPRPELDACKRAFAREF